MCVLSLSATQRDAQSCTTTHLLVPRQDKQGAAVEGSELESETTW